VCRWCRLVFMVLMLVGRARYSFVVLRSSTTCLMSLLLLLYPSNFMSDSLLFTAAAAVLIDCSCCSGLHGPLGWLCRWCKARFICSSCWMMIVLSIQSLDSWQRVEETTVPFTSTAPPFYFHFTHPVTLCSPRVSHTFIVTKCRPHHSPHHFTSHQQIVWLETDQWMSRLRSPPPPLLFVYHCAWKHEM
jgi:hypothetical protein